MAQEENHALCRRYNVTGYPTLYAVGRGLSTAYGGPATAVALRRWLRSLPAERCAGALGNVVPLCRAHFPREEAKHPWLVVLYRKGFKGSGALEAAAVDLAQGKQKERLERLKESGQVLLAMSNANLFAWTGHFSLNKAAKRALGYCASHYIVMNVINIDIIQYSDR